MSRSHAIQLHQAAHGYLDGHRQFALSAALTPRDTKTLLILSDSSGPGARFPERGYLTGYPLTESGFYVLARTWPAPEMPRPGCVWTHTLLIGFTELAALEDVSGLNSLFKRPRAGSQVTYQKPFLWTPQQTTTAIDREEARHILTAVYGEPNQRIVTAVKSSEAEDLVLAVWGQQWPRLRRGFRFCTYSGADRSSAGADFDLQMVPPHETSIRSRFPKAFDASRAKLPRADWVEVAVDDLCSDGEHELRTFFRRVGGDLTSGRGAFALLCRLYELLHCWEAEGSLANAMALLDDEFEPSEGRYARTAIAREAALHARDLDEPGFDFLMRNLNALGTEADDKTLDHVGEQIWARRPQDVPGLLHGDGVAQAAAERGLDTLPADLVINALSLVPELVGTVLERRRAIVTEPSFWSVDGLDHEAALLTVSGDASKIEDVARALIAAGRGGLANVAVDRLGFVAIAQALAETDPFPADTRWLRALARDVAAVAQFFSQGAVHSHQLLVGLARVLPPDAVPNEIGIDPWLTVCGQVEGLTSHADSIYLSAYLLSRAFGTRSLSSAALTIHSFETVHTALSEDQLPAEGWALIVPRLPRTFYWMEWDRCRRVREGVGRLFVERQFPPIMLGQLTSDDDLFAAVVSAISSAWGGHTYLRNVRKAMWAEDEYKYRNRRRIIKRVLSYI
jgi:hypothetical protein